MTNISSYEQQAIDFLNATGATLEIVFDRNDKYFHDDIEPRDIYKCTLKRGGRKYSFEFGNSMNNSGFFAQYGKTKYPIPYAMLNDSDAKIKQWVKYNCHSDFGSVKNDSIRRPKAPTAYDILACLQKYPVYSFEDFCSEYGYDVDSRKAYKTYKAVKREWENICILFTDAEIEQLREIQ